MLARQGQRKKPAAEGSASFIFRATPANALPLVPPLATERFDYPLPPELIAQTPAARRQDSRLLVVDRKHHSITHRRFGDLPEYLTAGDALFRNNAAVLPARLQGRRPSGGHVECFLLRPLNDHTWRCLVRPGRKLPVGATFADPTGAFNGEIVGREPDGAADVRFTTPAGQTIVDVANRLGEVPLPPYIARPETDALAHAAQRATDLARYQTVYADHQRQVAVAAPTAGLHFTPELLAGLEAQGVRMHNLTLHVGLGTFRPISTEDVAAHAIHRELYEIPWDTQVALFPPHAGRRIAVGTTSVRTVEDFLATNASARADERAHLAEAGIFIYPPRRFRGIDALITNFHQPRSTLLCLLAAFLTPGSTDGIGWFQEIYREAIAEKYRFLSYGDAMLIL